MEVFGLSTIEIISPAGPKATFESAETNCGKSRAKQQTRFGSSPLPDLAIFRFPP
jgi:hypothetical protein